MTPRCCGFDARWVVQSIRLAYFFCDECRSEVSETVNGPDTYDIEKEIQKAYEDYSYACASPVPHMVDCTCNICAIKFSP